jgi:protein-tyrosine phosphatase
MTNAICVDFLDEGDSGLPGRIGMTIAPGKKADGWWDRDLDTDLARLRAEYGCDLLVSLMEDDEYRWLQIEDLFVRAPAHGIAVLRFPIEDACPPRAGEMPQFIELIGQILEAARAGQTVVIHCRGLPCSPWPRTR